MTGCHKHLSYSDADGALPAPLQRDNYVTQLTGRHEERYKGLK